MIYIGIILRLLTYENKSFVFGLQCKKHCAGMAFAGGRVYSVCHMKPPTHDPGCVDFL